MRSKRWLSPLRALQVARRRAAGSRRRRGRPSARRSTLVRAVPLTPSARRPRQRFRARRRGRSWRLRDLVRPGRDVRPDVADVARGSRTTPRATLVKAARSSWPDLVDLPRLVAVAAGRAAVGGSATLAAARGHADRRRARPGGRRAPAREPTRGRLRDVLATGCSVGAPPDPFNQTGQDWSQPPWHPERLADAGYAPYRDARARGAPTRRRAARRPRHRIVPAVVGPGRHCLPRRAPTSATTTRRWSGSSRWRRERAGAVVIGEDLGVVEPWVREHLDDSRASSARRSRGSRRGGASEPLAPRALARGLPRHGHDPRPATDRRLPAG